MPETTEAFVRLLDVEEIGPDTFRGSAPAASSLAKTFGGQALAQAFAAAARTVDGRPPHSLHAHFLVGSDPLRPIDFTVERMRDGRSFSTRRVVAHQDGELMYHVVASFHVGEQGFEHAEGKPCVPEPEACPPLWKVIEDHSTTELGPWRDEWNALDMRYAGDPKEPPGHPQRFWIRTHDPLPRDPIVHQASLAYYSDYLLVASGLARHGIFAGAPDIPRSSLDHALWFHAPVRADDWLLIDQRSGWAGNGRAHGSSNIFNQEGVQVATVAQEGLIRRLRPNPPSSTS